MERSAAAIRLTGSAHHQCVSRRRECIIVFFDQEAVLSVVQAIFFEPAVVLALKNFPAAATHPVVHLGHAGLDRQSTIFKCCLLVHHVETGIGILTHEWDAGARQRLLSAIMRPRPAYAPRPHGIDMLQRGLIAQPQCSHQIKHVEIAIPPALAKRRVMGPAEINAAEPNPILGHSNGSTRSFSSSTKNTRPLPIWGMPRVLVSRSCSGYCAVMRALSSAE